jgi:hypothetical protein
MPRPRIEPGVLALLALVAGVVVAGCAGGASEQPRPSSDAQRAEQQQRAEGQDADGESVRGQDRKSVEGEDGDRGSSSSQSSSITQSSEGGSNQSSSIVQRSGSGSVSSSSSSGPGVKTFSGNGATTLSFNVEEPSRLAWTNSEGKRFSARGDGISIDSSSGRGEVSLDPGGYDGVKVSGSRWTIVVRPR